MAVNAQVICEQVCAGEIVVNTFGVGSATAVSPLNQNDAFAVAEEFVNLYDNLSTVATPNRGIREMRPNDATLTRVVVREVLPGNVPGLFFESQGASQGTNANPIMPIQSSVVVSMRTLTPGRRGRGRVYLGPFTQMHAIEQASAGQWNNVLIDACTNGVFDLNERLNALVPNAFGLRVWSRVDAAFRIVTALRATSKIYNQRRRNVRTPTSLSVAATI